MRTCIRRLLALVLIGAVVAMAAGPVSAAKYATHHINWLLLTPTKVYVATKIGDYSTPNTGNKYLIIMFHTVNKDDVPQSVSSSDFKARLSNGQIVSPSYTNPTPDLNSTLDVNASYDGGLNFEVPASIHSMTVTWSPSPGFSEVKWPSYTWRFYF